MKTIEERLAHVESRLDRLERMFRLVLASKGAASDLNRPARAAAPISESANARPVKPSPALVKQDPWKTEEARFHAPSVTHVMGWTGATVLVLAMAYLIRLAIDVGWLTPERQLGLAVLGGFALIGIGLRLRSSDRRYASLLPASGLVVLFLSIYGAHLFYHFIGAQAATGAVIVVCIGSLWLNRLFESEIYALFSVVGSYSAPFLLQTLSGSVIDLAVYYTAWSVLFCIYAVWIGRRHTYLLAAYMALIGFHYLWGQMASDQWVAAFWFQIIQFACFLGGAVVFSIRHNRPMEVDDAVAHLPLLLIFYALQYSLLKAHLPSWAPWIALCSAAVLPLVYVIAGRVMAQPLKAGGLLVSAYASLALFHAGYMELVPRDFEPWVGLLVLPMMGVFFLLRSGNDVITWPLRALVAIIFSINYLRVIAYADVGSVAGGDVLALLYGAELYLAYYLVRRFPRLEAFAVPLLYAGHVALMVAAIRIFDERLLVSLAWGMIALACLALAFRIGDKALGKSSLLIFAASAVKVLLFDISIATPLVRIGSLLILGVTLYMGGWMYKKVDMIDAQDPEAKAGKAPA